MTHELDSMMDELFAAVRPDGGFEDRVIARLRAARAPFVLHPLVRRAAVGVAAAILLGGVGFVVTHENLFTDNGAVAVGTVPATAPIQKLDIKVVDDIDGDIRASQMDPEKSRLATIDDLKRTESRLAADGRHDEAKGVADQIKVLDPALTSRSSLETPRELAGRFTRDVMSSETSAGFSVANSHAVTDQLDTFLVPSEDHVSDAQPTRPGLAALQRGGGEGAKEAIKNYHRSLSEADADFDRRANKESAKPTDAPVPGQQVQSIEGNEKVVAPNFTDAPNFSLTQNGSKEKSQGLFGQAPADGDPRFFEPGEVATGERLVRRDRASKPATDSRFGLPSVSSGNLVVGPSAAQVGQSAGKATGSSVLALGVDASKVAEQKNSPDPTLERGSAVKTLAQATQAQPQSQAQQADPAPAVAVHDPQAGRKVIRNGDMRFEVDSYDSAVAQIAKIAAEEGGFVSTTESEKMPNGKVQGSVIVRCPPDRLDTLVLKLRGLGDLKNSKIAAQDITKQYTDLDAQLRAAKTMEERLIEIIKSGKGTVKELLEAEKQLGTWREKSEKLEGEIRYYNNLISLSTLTVALAERDVRAASLLSETEQVNMGVEAEDVEKARAEAIKAIDEAKGRVVASDLKKHDAGQFSATITADLAPDVANVVVDRLKQLGRVARLDAQRRQSTAEGTGTPVPGTRVERKETRLILSIYNLANVAPRTTTSLELAADDVEKSYRAILSQIESAGGRVVDSRLNKPTPDQVIGSISFESAVTAADGLLSAVRSVGEVMQLGTTTNPDTQNSTDAKRGFSVQLRSTASVPPGEMVSMQLAVDDVATKYDTLLSALRKVGASMATSQINQQEPGNTTATLEVDVRRANRPAVDKALADAGGVYGRLVSRAPRDQVVLEDKARLSITLNDVDKLPPRETTTIGIEAADVTKVAGDIEATAIQLGGRKVDSDWAQQPGGQTIARVVVDVPLAKAPELLAKAKGNGHVLTVQRDQAPGSPEGPFARARLSATISNADPIVAGDQGLLSSIREGLSTSVEWLLRSVTFIVIGLCLVAPWAIVLWVGWKIVRRKKRAVSTAPTP